MIILDGERYLLFLISTLLLCITPGPDMFYILAVSMQAGVRPGIIAALGMAVGMLFYSLAASLGLGLLAACSSHSFYIIQIIGGGYLIWMGLQGLLRPRHEKMGKVEALGSGVVFRRALLTNLLNPKVVLFYAAYLPQFTNPGLGQMQGQLLLLGLSFLILGLTVDSLVALLSGHLGKYLSQNILSALRLQYLSALIYIGLGVRLFFV